MDVFSAPLIFLSDAHLVGIRDIVVPQPVGPLSRRADHRLDHPVFRIKHKNTSGNSMPAAARFMPPLFFSAILLY